MEAIAIALVIVGAVVLYTLFAHWAGGMRLTRDWYAGAFYYGDDVVIEGREVNWKASDTSLDAAWRSPSGSRIDLHAQWMYERGKYYEPAFFSVYVDGVQHVHSVQWTGSIHHRRLRAEVEVVLRGLASRVSFVRQAAKRAEAQRADQERRKLDRL